MSFATNQVSSNFKGKFILLIQFDNLLPNYSEKNLGPNYYRKQLTLKNKQIQTSLNHVKFRILISVFLVQ